MRLQSLGRSISMTLYKVQITNKALADMEEIYTYIAEVLQTPDNAMNQYNRIAKAIERLAVFPERIKIMETEPEHDKNIRQMNIDNYAVFYVIRERRVVVFRVLYGASNISRRLLESEEERTY